jgi:hypothetical protein
MAEIPGNVIQVRTVYPNERSPGAHQDLLILKRAIDDASHSEKFFVPIHHSGYFRAGALVSTNEPKNGDKIVVSDGSANIRFRHLQFPVSKGSRTFFVLIDSIDWNMIAFLGKTMARQKLFEDKLPSIHQATPSQTLQRKVAYSPCLNCQKHPKYPHLPPVTRHIEGICAICGGFSE